MILNRTEYVADRPASEDIAGGLAALDSPPVVEQFLRDVQRRMVEPPERQQQFLQRGDNGKVVRTQAEYARCARKGVPLRTISYDEAEALVAAEDAKREERHEKRKRRKGKR